MRRLPRASSRPPRRALLRAARRGALVASAVLAWAALVALASADEPVEPIRVRYEAPAECPDEGAFVGEVRARTSRARLAAAGERARSFEVAVARRGGRFQGRLDVREPSGAASRREVSGASCAEVVSALALVTALAVDPRASTSARAAPALSATPDAAPLSEPAAPSSADASASGAPAGPLPPADAGAPDAASPEASVDAAVDASAGASPPAARPAPPVPVASAPAEPDPYASRPVRLFLGLGYGARSGLAPQLAPESTFFLEASLPPRGLLAPALRLSLERDAGLAIVASDGYLARFERTAARLDGCVVRLPLGPVDLAPCASFAAGVLAGEGRVGGAVVTAARPWVDAALAARARVSLFERLSLELDAGGFVPFVRDSFVFEPGTTVHETPPAGAFFGGAAGIRLW
jgi:hypothetical protein